MRANYFANFVVIVGGIFFLVLFIYELYGLMRFGIHKHQLIYCITYFVGIVVCFFIFRMPKEYKINLMLIGISTCVGVYSVEIFLFHLKSTIHQRIARKIETGFDARSKGEIIKELNAQGLDAYPSFYPYLTLPTNGLDLNGKKLFPLGGLSRKTTVFCNEAGKWLVYSSDEHGFNNPTGLFKNNNGIDSVLVGDSFAQGICVKQGEDIASQLRSISELQVITLGMGGNGPLLEFASLKEYAEPLKPKHVLWLYYEGNDLRELAVEQESPFLLNYRSSRFSQNLINKQPEIDLTLLEYMGKIEDAPEMNEVTKILKLWHLRLLLFRPSVPPLFAELLKKAKDLTVSWEGKLYFVYLPAWNRYVAESKNRDLYHRQQVLSIVQDLDIPVIDIHDKVFATHPDPQSLFPFRVFGHYTPEGYGLVAQEIQSTLTK